MSITTMVVAIVLIAAIARILAPRFHAPHETTAPPAPSADAQRAAEELRQLKERVAVLERVITDHHGSLDLDREIARLRDR